MKSRSLLNILFVVVVWSCIDPIKIDIPREKPKFIIYGQLTDLSGDHFISITKTVDENAPLTLVDGILIPASPVPLPVSGASVSVNDSNQNRYICIESSPGVYRITGLEKALAGIDYWIEILIGENLYTSTPAKLPNAIGEDSVYYKIDEGTSITKDGKRLTRLLNIFSKTKLPDESVFLRWSLSETYYWDLTFFPNPFNTPPPPCFVSGVVDPQRINLLESNGVNTTVDQFLGSRETDQTFKNRHYITINQFSITESSYSYWNQVDLLTKNTGSVFDIPPASIKGNIKSMSDSREIVLGYFDVCRKKESRFYIVPGLLPFSLGPYCEYDPNKPFDEYPKECLSCSNIKNGTEVAPLWW